MIKEYTLKNGITVVMEKLTLYRSVSMGIWIKAGSAYEDDTTNGVAHAIEHMLFKGTGKRTSRQLADEMTEIGGNIDAYTSKEFTCFFAKTLSEHLSRVIDILGDMITDSLIDPGDLYKELGVICEEIDMYDDSPEDIVHEQLQRSVWRDHPIGYLISGKKEIVRAFERDTLKLYMEEKYTGNRMVIALAGNFDEDQVIADLEEAFGKIPYGDGPGIKERAVKACYHPSIYTCQKDIEQIHMIMAFESLDFFDSRKYILAIVNSIIGGNVNSRLFQKIREELGLTYSVESYNSSYEAGGLFHIYAAIHPCQLNETMDAIAGIIIDMKRNPVSERELRIVKEQIKTDLIIGSESTYNRVSAIGKAYIHGCDVTSIEDAIKKIDKVTVPDVMQFMKDCFRFDTLSMSLAGDISEIDQDHLRKKIEIYRNSGI